MILPRGSEPPVLFVVRRRERRRHPCTVAVLSFPASPSSRRLVPLQCTPVSLRARRLGRRLDSVHHNSSSEASADLPSADHSRGPGVDRLSAFLGSRYSDPQEGTM